MATPKLYDLYKEKTMPKTQTAETQNSWTFTFDGTPLNLQSEIEKAKIPEEVKTLILAKNVGKRVSVHSHGETPVIEPSEGSGPEVPTQIISITLKCY
jgi:hypothetical protein